MWVVDFNSSLGFGDKHIGADAKKVENVQNLGYWSFLILLVDSYQPIHITLPLM